MRDIYLNFPPDNSECVVLNMLEELHLSDALSSSGAGGYPLFDRVIVHHHLGACGRHGRLAEKSTRINHWTTPQTSRRSMIHATGGSKRVRAAVDE